MNNPTYVATQNENLRQAIEKAQAIARATTNKKVSLTFQGTEFEVSSDMKLQEAINKYLSVKDKLYKEQKTNKR